MSGPGPPTTILSELAQRHREEVLASRLSAAASLPADQRLPDIAAFIEASALLQAARQLLPLTPPGSAAATAAVGPEAAAR